MEDQLFEVYLRDENGNTYHAPLRDGMKQFLSEYGYRISINIEGVVLTLRKGASGDSMKQLDTMVGGQETVDCAITVRGL